MTAAFIHGFILAIGLILPLGVQNFFIFTQGSVSKRFISLLPIVVTASICDTLLITLAVFGVSVTIMSFVWMKSVLVIGGFIFLIYMGFITWRSKIEDKKSAGHIQSTSPGKMVSFTLMISLLNPHAILDTIGVLGTSSLTYQGYNKMAFMIACIFVSWCWFFTLAFLGRLIGIKDKNGRILSYLNKVSAVVMWVAAIYLLSVF
jgi:L-lysine exporter family protein LysE/ArgO